jgi:hypothetical protein
MRGKARSTTITAAARFLPAVLALFLALALLTAAANRVHFRARFMPGQTLYYQVESHTSSTGETVTPIVNAEGGTKFSENVDLLVRLDVLPNSTSSGMPPDAVRLRAIYERAHADSQSDSPRVDAPSAAADYARLQGSAFELTLGPTGAISHFQDTGNVSPNASEALTAFSWIRELVAGNSFPLRGIAIGDKWTSARPVDDAPLTGLVWRADSNYMRDEPCQSAIGKKQPGRAPAAPIPQCAVILTRFQIVRHGSSHADQTPPDYVRHGLRTAGTLTGSGESLDSISLATGLLVNSTQTSMQRSDFDIISAVNGEKIHRQGQIQVQEVITQVPAPPEPAAAKP